MTLPFCLATLPFVGIDTDAICSQQFARIQTIALTDLTTPAEHFKRFGKKYETKPETDIDDDLDGKL